MDRCVMCGGTELRDVAEAVEVTIGPRSFVGAVPAVACPKCGETFTDGPGLVALEREAARWLAAHGFATGPELRFMRKAAGLRAVDLAELLDVAPETVSHWETGKHAPDRSTLATVAALALDALDGATTTRDRLRALRERPPLAKVRLELPAARAAT